MRKIKKLTESDLNRIVKKVINEQSDEEKTIYRMYVKDIEAEMSNIDNSINALEDLHQTIDMDENLNEDEKEDLIMTLRDYLSHF